MHDPKWLFLQGNFQYLTILASFQRSHIYAADATWEQGLALRTELCANLVDLAQQYTVPVGDEQHLRNIGELCDHLTERCSPTLKAGRFRIGIGQKALNLYLKYLWCAGRIAMPPHCPFDRNIISRLALDEDITWTTLDSVDDYRMLVAAARRVAGAEPLAEWELRVFEEAVG
jgi:hypothetical protein